MAATASQMYGNCMYVKRKYRNPKNRFSNGQLTQ